jgi:hypothetical protein
MSFHQNRESRREGKTLRYIGWAIAFIAVLVILYAIFGSHEARSEPLPRPKPPQQSKSQPAPDAVLMMIPMACRPLAKIQPQAKAQHVIAGRVGGNAMLLDLYPDQSWMIWIIRPDGYGCALAMGTELEWLQKIIPPGEDS